MSNSSLTFSETSTPPVSSAAFQERPQSLRLTVTIVFEQTGSAQDPFGNVRVGFEGEVTVNRKDWGLSWNAALETGGVLVSEKVKLEFDISAIRA